MFPIMSLDMLIKEAERLSADERRKLLQAVVMIDAPQSADLPNDAIAELIAHPIRLAGFQPLSRDEAHSRQ